MPRLKPKNRIVSREQAEAAMARLSDIDRQIARLDLDEAEEIARVRDKFAMTRKSCLIPEMETEKSLLVKELEAWAETDRDAWPIKSIETPFGRLGFREKNPAVVLYKAMAKKLEDALGRLTARMPEYVRKAPSIDKEKILAAHREGTLDLAKLQRCGLRIDEGEDFWIETAASKDLADAAKALKDA